MTETEEPNLEYVLRAKDEPKLTKLHIESEEPMRTKLLSESAEPMFPFSITDNDPPMLAGPPLSAPNSENADPSLAKLRRDSDEPI